tara:strand:+ start:201 stop:371 length:171 start_codon:yes stop_codon:yes gene_type:complete
MENLNLSIKLVNEVLGYLATRPYQESAGLINAIQAEFQKQAAQDQMISSGEQSETS